MTNSSPKRIILAITGASGGIIGLRILKILNELNHEVHFIISPSGERCLKAETGQNLDQIKHLASVVYDPFDISASIASGSFHRDGMIIVPCSVKTLSAIANSYSDNLITRSADVCLKEGKPLILGFRETPLHPGHIRLMRLASEAGAILFPLVPSFYGNPKSIDDIVNGIAGRILQRCSISNSYYFIWKQDLDINP